MNKIKLIIIMLMCTVFLSACGTVSKNNEIQIEGKTVRIEQIEVNEEIRTVKRIFNISGKEEIDKNFLNNLFPENLLTVRWEWKNNKNVIVTEAKFYENEDEWWKIQYNREGNFEEYIFDTMETKKSEEKEFFIECDGKQVFVVVTPNAISVNGEEGWMQEKKLYQVVAVMEDGDQQEIYTLPFQKNKKMEERELLILPYLGDGFRIGEEIKNENGIITGGKLILNQDIHIDSIADVYIY